MIKDDERPMPGAGEWWFIQAAKRLWRGGCYWWIPQSCLNKIPSPIWNSPDKWSRCGISIPSRDFSGSDDQLINPTLEAPFLRGLMRLAALGHRWKQSLRRRRTAVITKTERWKWWEVLLWRVPVPGCLERSFWKAACGGLPRGRGIGVGLP